MCVFRGARGFCLHVCSRRDNAAVWEWLLRPVVAWTHTHCFYLIEALIWPSSDLCVCCLVFNVVAAGAYLMICASGQYFLCLSRQRLHCWTTREASERARGKYVTFDPQDTSLTLSRAGSFTAESKVVGRCDTGPDSQSAMWRNGWVNI